MSLNYKMMERPSKWVSAHRANRFKYRLPVTTISSGYDDGNGYLKLNLSSAFYYPLAVGDRVYIPAGTDYTGFHTIRTVHSTIQYTLETTYTSLISGSATIYEVILPIIKLYRGYNTGELVVPLYPSGSIDMATVQERELIAEFVPEANIDGFISFDISGYLKASLDSPYVFMYNEDLDNYNKQFKPDCLLLLKDTQKIDVIIDGNLECSLIACNAAITTEDLNRYFVDTIRPLSPLKQGAFFGSDYNSEYITQTLNSKQRYGSQI